MVAHTHTHISQQNPGTLSRSDALTASHRHPLLAATTSPVRCVYICVCLYGSVCVYKSDWPDRTPFTGSGKPIQHIQFAFLAEREREREYMAAKRWRV